MLVQLIRAEKLSFLSDSAILAIRLLKGLCMDQSKFNYYFNISIFSYILSILFE